MGTPGCTCDECTGKAKRRDAAHALECAQIGETIRMCRGDWRICTKWQPRDMGCCAHIVKTRDLTVDEILARSGPN